MIAKMTALRAAPNYETRGLLGITGEVKRQAMSGFDRLIDYIYLRLPHGMNLNLKSC
jgi:hypothetical protein